jgi:hypothetical protein
MGPVRKPRSVYSMRILLLIYTQLLKCPGRPSFGIPGSDGRVSPSKYSEEAPTDVSRVNDSEERCKRYRKFNIEELIAAATRSVKGMPKQCTGS